MSRFLGCLLAISWAAAGSLGAQTLFVDESAARGLTSYEALAPGFGAGVAAADYDDDGDVDLFLPADRGEPHRLYRNDGAGQFSEIASLVGLDLTDGARTALWVDADGDHRLDLLVAGDCYQSTCGESTVVRLLRQLANGTFEDVTETSGLEYDTATNQQHRSGFAAGDVNLDGFLDIVSAEWEGQVKLYLNQGDGTFVDETVASGIDTTHVAYHQAVLVDLDADGLLDLYTSVDFEENRLWMNQGVTGGIPSFLEVAAAAGCDNAMNDMGVAVGDFDDDGDPDLYVTNIFGVNEHNVFYRMDTDAPPVFSEISEQLGVDDGGWGWGTTFADVDNDGYLDLAETNGWAGSMWDGPPRLFLHQQDMPPTYVDHAATSGLTEISWGSALIAFDADRDGDLDLAQTVLDGAPDPDKLSLYENQLDQSPGDRHYLLIRPRMDGPNHRALGAKITVEVVGRTLTRWILAGSSYLGQEPAEAFFGLGPSETAARVDILWPGGLRSRLSGVPADQVLTVESDVIFASGLETGSLGEW